MPRIACKLRPLSLRAQAHLRDKSFETFLFGMRSVLDEWNNESRSKHSAVSVKKARAATAAAAPPALPRCALLRRCRAATGLRAGECAPGELAWAWRDAAWPRAAVQLLPLCSRALKLVRTAYVRPRLTTGAQVCYETEARAMLEAIKLSPA